MTKEDIQGFALIPVAFMGCVYHEELASFVGTILHMILG